MIANNWPLVYDIYASTFLTFFRLHRWYFAECRINYCWTKLCLFLDVRCEHHWSRSSFTNKSGRYSDPAGKQSSSELDYPSCQAKLPFIQNLQSLREKKLNLSSRKHTCPIRPHWFGPHFFFTVRTDRKSSYEPWTPFIRSAHFFQFAGLASN